MNPPQPFCGLAAVFILLVALWFLAGGPVK